MLRSTCDLGRRMANRLNSWKLMSELPSTSMMIHHPAQLWLHQQARPRLASALLQLADGDPSRCHQYLETCAGRLRHSCSCGVSQSHP